MCLGQGNSTPTKPTIGAIAADLGRLDDLLADFGAAMSQRLAEKAADGKTGWEDSERLRHYAAKLKWDADRFRRDFGTKSLKEEEALELLADIANVAMFLWRMVREKRT